MFATLLVLRVVHILSAVIWAGTAIFLAAFLEPALRASGPAGAMVMLSLFKRKVFSIIPIFAVASVLSGAWMFWTDSNGFDSLWMGSPTGIGLSVGATFGVLALLVGLTVLGPTGNALGPLIEEAVKTPEGPARDAIMRKIGPLRDRLRLGGRLTAVLVVCAAIVMSVARYLGQ